MRARVLSEAGAPVFAPVFARIFAPGFARWRADVACVVMFRRDVRGSRRDARIERLARVM
ncbi:hypothetical protein BTO02_19460 [Paraburkholderia sp. SOS3]|nr:hypothetical protein BTO02_19460 [Paraburkholderia sp. SOS3]